VRSATSRLPIYLFVCWFLVLIVGVALVRLYSYRRKIGV